ncbi:MAG: BatA domain-containing protein [Gemmatimonadaceae bacterium]
MLSFVAPGYLAATLAAAVALVAAHFIVRRQPRALMLPTARFVPDAPVLTVGWARVPADLVVLALRVLCVLLAGLGLAGPFLRQSGEGIARVILADRSRAIGDSGEVSDSVAAIRAPEDVVIGYGPGTFEEFPATVQGSAASTALQERGSLSAGLVAAVRAASRHRDRADSVELVIVSSFAAEEIDAATARLRREWPGRARLVTVSARAAPRADRRPALEAGADDPLAVALAIARPVGHADVRIVRRGLSRLDSSWVAGDSGRVLVHWPVRDAPAGFIAMRQPQFVGGFATRATAVIAPSQRRWQHVPALGSRPVAWWIDGEVAASEIVHGLGCVRSVAIPVAAGGDFALRPELHSALRELVQPCGGAPALQRAAASSLAKLAGAGALATPGMFAPPDRDTATLAKWLMIAALLCALLELIVRGRKKVSV